MRHYHGGFALRTDVNHVETKEKPLFTTIDVQAVTALSIDYARINVAFEICKPES